MDQSFWRDKKVLVTGHTGFKGGWLSLWLNQLGANVSGLSLAPTKENVFYSRVFSDNFIGMETFDDINDFKRCYEFIEETKPDIIFHLAAQPLVRHSYKNPLDNFRTNILGLVHLLEIVRISELNPIIVNVTTDKVYENNEWIWAYRENEKLGGEDPYSASKACSEIITNSYAKSFFKSTPVRIATARAGNVIGGGDMSNDRLIPDFLRALEKKQQIILRNPLATRPWQHVLEPVFGYLKLAEKLSQDGGENYIGAWNFGPLGDAVSVGKVVEKLSEISGGAAYDVDKSFHPHEAQSLMLDSAKARKKLDWKPKLSINDALFLTYEWFSRSLVEKDMLSFSLQQIEKYQQNE